MSKHPENYLKSDMERLKRSPIYMARYGLFSSIASNELRPLLTVDAVPNSLSFLLLLVYIWSHNVNLCNDPKIVSGLVFAPTGPVEAAIVENPMYTSIPPFLYGWKKVCKSY
jgi:hypothetical protein